MVDSYDHLAVDWENALRPAPATSVFEKRNMTADRERYMEVREQEGEG